jgi:dihydrofolate synthase/folylpolyglutamate synthase
MDWLREPRPDPLPLHDPAFEATVESRLGTIARRGLIRLELDAMRALLQRLGSPQRLFRSIHVAGTNGKGSTAAMVESALRTAGYRTGLYTSPHLESYRERIQLEGAPIAPDRLLKLLDSHVLPAAQQLELVPTEFDLLTATAFLAFAEAGLDIAIIEVGLGGRLDSTNVLADPLATVITSIGLDHTDRLGTTIAEIAGEKAGIIKAGRPVVTAATGEALQVIEVQAGSLGAPLTAVKAATSLGNSPVGQRLQFTPDTPSPLAGEYEIPLLGRHQLQNAALALQTLETIAPWAPVSREAAVAGLAGVHWPGRMERLSIGGVDWVLDGAHNPAGCDVFKEGLRQHFGDRKLGLVLGMVADKDWQAMAGSLSGLAEQTWLTAVPNPRGLDPELVSAVMADSRPQVIQRFEDALSAAREWAAAQGPEALIVIAGSLYLIGACRTALHAAAGPMVGPQAARATSN